MPPIVQRWKFFDPADPDPLTREWTVPINPNRMGSLFPTRRLSVKSSSAVDGQPLVFEGQAPLQDWSFGGAILDSDHHEMLRSWVYDRSGRIRVTDHFGREIWLMLTTFKPEPKRDIRRYWRHEYEIEATVISVGVPTVFEYAP